MEPATSWDGAGWGARGRGWSVMSKLRTRQDYLRQQAADARNRLSERKRGIGYMTPALMAQDYEDSVTAKWQGGPSVLAFLFAPPDSDAIRALDARGGYFDVRTGNTWDLFFPGYYRSAFEPDIEQYNGAYPVGHTYARDWYFSPIEFNALREHIERSSGWKWEYSGGTDLVLINGWLSDAGEPTIDWPSTISGRVPDQGVSSSMLSLGTLIERITRDLETDAEDPLYGVGDLVDPSTPPQRHVTRDFVVNALSGIAAALGVRALGV
jgi:hypothetical protein